MFGMKIRETTQVKFQTACQGPEEKLDDWADRVLLLATGAFQGLPDDYCEQQAINRLCQGLGDKEAGQHVHNEKTRIHGASNR